MENLFNRYKSAFNALDADAIARCYTLPCATSDGDGRHAYSDKEALIEKFRINCQVLKSAGYKTASYSINESKSLGSHATALDLTWDIQFESSSLTFNALYICHNIDDEWLIFSVNVY